MLFPVVERVVYRRKTLDEVICQLRFPPILRIDSEPPAAYQERIRGAFPLYEEQKGEFSIKLPDEIASFVRANLPTAAPVTHQFKTSDAEWTVGLTREFIALSTPNYQRWEIFKQHLTAPVQALIDEYNPSFFSRIGLRYRDVISRSALGIDTPWSELLRPFIAAELTTGDPIASAVREATHLVVLALPDNHGTVRMRHGLAQTESGEQVYAIDSDFFLENRTETSHVFDILDNFNAEARGLFRWCITPALHEALDPEPIR